ncbi:response regulator [Jannaschia seohaensis]|uniref:Two-component system chemotaxis response regulator CheY n=1 Tax=Jannaschia seohaensis TaxID=475081 RepID=A0A2Y9B238_9RHOB|nr:response regulator [Jannaschia seohaensis]PWJ15854.1 two-component system chemotaxis response regulator CheY [Jannaschia seohaensis]SSA49558.1 two-component system, chemotaxis family, response regulator CheY [Jannaschia seohaensis]
MSLRESLKILVVDDMSTSRGLLLQALDSLGIRNVEYATDGKNAIQKARTNPPHLVLSDLYMPEMNGLQLLQHLRHDPVTKRIGFILITGRSDEKVIKTGKSLGMNNFLPKPFTVADIKATIEAVVGRL